MGRVRPAPNLFLVVLDVGLHVFDECRLVANLRPYLRQVLYSATFLAATLATIKSGPLIL